MTLGGLALAVGILVDDATVEIENIHRNLAHGQAAACRRSSTARSRSPCRRSSRRSASASCSSRWCSSTGAARFLFTPLALAVVFAMLASYLLSRTLVPTMVHYLLAAEVARATAGGEHGARSSRVHLAPSRGLQPRLRARFASGYVRAARAGRSRTARARAGGVRGRSSLRRSALLPFVGRGLLPDGRRRPDPPARPGPGRARASRRPSGSSARSRTRSAQVIPADEIAADPRQHRPAAGGINLAFSDSATIGAADGEILIVAQARAPRPDARTTCGAPGELRRGFPQLTFFFQPADIVSQILNFGLPAPIDIQVVGRNRRRRTSRSRREIADRVAAVPGAGGRAPAPGGGRPELQRRRRSHPRGRRSG